MEKLPAYRRTGCSSPDGRQFQQHLGAAGTKPPEGAVEKNIQSNKSQENDPLVMKPGFLGKVKFIGKGHGSYQDQEDFYDHL